jgi:predicted dehydrogenase
MQKWRVAGVSFEHMHMGDLLREAHEHPEAEIVGVCDPDPTRMADAIAAFQIPPERVFCDIDECLRATSPDVVVLCPATARHAEVVEAVARHRVDILLEKPFAASLADADRILAAVAAAGIRLAINWPLRWYPAHMTAKRLIDEGAVGEVIEVHFYDGNRGPLSHRADKVVVSEAEVRAAKPTSWWYSAAAGGGSLLDYLGYGATLGTWFFNGQAPIEVTSVVDQPAGLEVDEHSITICRYARGISKFETRWGAFTDPWITQPQPKCGFVIVGSEGTISSYDFEPTVGLQTRDHPVVRDIAVDTPQAPFRGPVEYVLHAKATGARVEGPLDPMLCRTAQRIVDTAALAAKERRTLALLP